MEHDVYDESHNCLGSKMRIIQRISRVMTIRNALCVIVCIAIEIVVETATIFVKTMFVNT